MVFNEKMEIDVHFLIGLKPNLLVLLQKHYDEIYDDMNVDDKYLISLYHIKTKTLEEVFTSTILSSMGEFHKVNYISNKRYLFMCY